ncbi:MAG: ABC transporter permease, partial [Candidatus Eiseniibacteriota bacterium]
MLNRLAARALPSLLALAGALLVSALIIAASGSSPIVAFGALFSGAFGSLDSLSEVGVKSCPLLLAGLAIAVSFQAGVWNIGAEGQLLI